MRPQAESFVVANHGCWGSRISIGVFYVVSFRELKKKSGRRLEREDFIKRERRVERAGLHRTTIVECAE